MSLDSLRLGTNAATAARVFEELNHLTSSRATSAMRYAATVRMAPEHLEGRTLMSAATDLTEAPARLGLLGGAGADASVESATNTPNSGFAMAPSAAAQAKAARKAAKLAAKAQPATPPSSAGPATITELKLVNARTKSDFVTLTNGQTVDVSQVGTSFLSIRAETDSATAGSIVFTMDGKRTKTDSKATYSLMGGKGFNYRGWKAKLGTHIVTATPYSEARGKGTAGETVTVTFTVVASTALGVDGRPNGGKKPATTPPSALPPSTPAGPGGGPSTGAPGTGDPTDGTPPAGAPSGGNPGAGDPTGGDPVVGNPSTGDPTGGDPTTGNPGGGSDPTGGNPTGGDPAGGGDPTTGTPTGGGPGDGVAPHYVTMTSTVGDGTAQRSQVSGFTLTFDEPVTLSDGAVKLERLNTGGSGARDDSAPTDASAAMAAPTSNDGGKTWVFTLATGAPNAFAQLTTADATTGSLVDGVYVATVDATKVVGATGDRPAPSSTLTFHRLFGDVDGNALVNNADYMRFKATFGKSAANEAYDATLDFDGSGKVNNADYLQFKNRFAHAFAY